MSWALRLLRVHAPRTPAIPRTMYGSPWHLRVFRESSRAIGARQLVGGVLDDVGAGRLADALVRAGEIESALADAVAPEAPAAAALTDALAEALLEPDAPQSECVRDLCRPLDNGGSLRVVPPEGFSYYALHPCDVAERAAAPPLDTTRQAAVLGVRSIGTTMSAVLCAALRRRGGRAERRTVRPRGVPYARALRFKRSEARWVAHHLTMGSEFVVIDEGPGLSGSTILSVVGALQAAGAALERILVVGTRQPDPARLLARDAALRWRALRVATVQCESRVPPDFAPLAPGGWRSRFLSADAPWPGCWTWQERAKALSSDGRRLLKFEGLGRHGSEARMRSAMAAAAGFGVPAREARDGQVAYDVAVGTPTCACRLDERTIDRVADYCAWRASLGPADSAGGALEDMARSNAAVALGVDIGVELEVARPVVADARMMPHEWIEAPEGVLWKTDAASHGDDHFFPGPTDVAWDLAGAAFEWRMPRPAIDRLLARYAERSGDRAEKRFSGWLLAYALYRLAWTELAAASVGTAAEEERLSREADAHRHWLRVSAGHALFGGPSRRLMTP
jgi:hypothetical protein